MAMHIIIQWQKNEERRENTITRGNMRPRWGKEARRERRIHEKNPKRVGPPFSNHKCV